MAAGSTSVSPPGGDGQGASGSDSDSGVTHSGTPTPRRLRFRGLTSQRRYALTLCTESNSGTLSKVVTVEADSHAEAPLVSSIFSCLCTSKYPRLKPSVFFNELISPFDCSWKEKSAIQPRY